MARPRFLLLTAGVVALLSPLSAIGLVVSLVPDPGVPSNVTHLQSSVDNYLCCGSGPVQEFDPVSLPFTDSHTAQGPAQPDLVSATAYSLDNAGFTIDMNHSRPRRAEAKSSGAIYFKLDQDSQYALSGNYAMVGLNYVQLEATLTNLSTGTLLFDNLQLTRAASPDVSLQLGQ